VVQQTAPGRVRDAGVAGRGNTASVAHRGSSGLGTLRTGEERVAAALDAGARIVRDAFAPAWWSARLVRELEPGTRWRASNS